MLDRIRSVPWYGVKQVELVKIDRVRVAAHDYIGSSVRVIEDGERIIAEIDGGRLLMLGAAPDVTYGAQDALPDLYLERIPLRLK